MIPEDKRAAVTRGLLEAFGTSAAGEIRQLDSGLSTDLVFRMHVQGAPRVLRIMTRVDERMDPRRIFACMRAAADAGVAPRLHYSNADEGISISDLVTAVPFPAAQALVQLPVTLRRLHALPPFPKTFNYVTAHNGFVWKLRGAGLFPAADVEEIFGLYEELCGVYPRRESDMVSCHGDLKPHHIRFDGRCAWLTGWQAAFVNDRYFDLAVAADFLVGGDADERIWLEQYFGQAADDYQRARFFLMRQVVHMLSAAVFLMLGSGGKPLEFDGNVPAAEEFHRRMWSGEVKLGEAGQRLLYGLVHWGQLVEGVRSARFRESLGTVGARNRSAEGVALLLPRKP